ncbi:MAG TPA: PIG-L family deacetylase [Gemmataceae bacterium]|nr:PIG-L family deacetylase [Gemmataceae bacterium]
MIRNAVLFAAVFAVSGVLAPCAAAAEQPKPAQPVRVIVFGAHPDDAELKAGGTAIKWAKLGHAVKMVSVTNGDIGHWKMAGGPLAARRLAEVKAADKVLGAATEVLDIHDGELEPTLENRRKIVRLIREWKADVVIAHRPWDYHPDHRYVGVLVQDAAFMVTVPNFCPDVPALKTNPLFLYASDGFQKPYRFRADIAVSLDEVFEQKLDALHELESQLYEGGALGSDEALRLVPPASDPAARKAWFRKEHFWARRDADVANQYRDALVTWYGPEKGKQVKTAEAFEVCEYGRRVTPEQIRQLFPFYE